MGKGEVGADRANFVSIKLPLGVAEDPLGLRGLKAEAVSFISDWESKRQKLPFPGSSWFRGILMK